jgi:hypothetical protein
MKRNGWDHDGPRARRGVWQARIACLAVAALVAGCNGSDTKATAQLRAVHASADAPNVDVLVNGKVEFANLAYGAASSFLRLDVGTASIAVNPAGTASTVLNAALPLTADHQYSAIVVGSASPSAPSGQQLQAVVVDDPGNPAASGNVKVRVVHGAPAVPPVDVYVTAPGAALPAAPTVAALAYTSVAPASGSKALEVPAGSYQIRIAVAGDATKTVVFDSGSIALAANADVLVTALPASGVAPVKLLVAGATGASSVVGDSRASIRIGHLSPNVPAVDVSLTAAGGTTAALSLPNVSFPTVSGYALVAAGTYDASVALASNPGTPVLSLPGATLASGSSTSVFAIGLLGGSGAQALQLAAFADDRMPVAGKAKVRVLHLAPDAPAVDVVALAADGSIAATLVTNLAYPSGTSTSLQVAPGDYALAVVPTGASAPVLPTAAGVPVTLSAGQVLTIAAVGCLTTGSGPCAGGQPFAFKVLTDN